MASKYTSDIVEPQEEVDFNPLDEAVNEKRYSQPNVSAGAADLNKPIEEPSFAPPPLQKRTIPQNDENKKREPINPEMRNIPKKETEMAASHMATLILQGYEWMHELGNKGLTVSEKKLNKLQSQGEINLNAMIDYDFGMKMRAGEFFKEYNQQVGSILKVSDEFKEEVRPVLERVLAKRGVGMTDEQLLMFMFGKDIAAKSLMFFQQKAQLNFMIETIKQASTSQFAQQAPPEPQPQPQQQQQQQQEQKQKPEDYVVAETGQSNANSIKPDIIVLPKKRQQGRPKVL